MSTARPWPADSLPSIINCRTEGGRAVSRRALEMAGLNQPRKWFDEDALADLAASIREHGIIQPLTVRRLSTGYYQIIAGEQPDVPGDHRGVHLAGEVALDLLRHLEGQVCPPVVHGEDHALQLQGGVQALLGQADGVQQVGKALQGVVLALDPRGAEAYEALAREFLQKNPLS